MKNNTEEIKELTKRLVDLKKQERVGTSTYIIPVAILIAGILIAGAVVYSGGNSNSGGQYANGAPTQKQAPSFGGGSSDNVNPVTSNDHIKGSIDALVKIVEFSDTECPFCKRIHPTLQKIVDEYGDSNKVAWVYRHLPLEQIHSKARIEAAATELANELGGNEKFWEYLDRLYEITPSNDGLDLSLLPQIAEDIGLQRKPFEDLVKEDDRRGGKYAGHIESDYQNALASGGNGTPYTVIIAPNGKTFALSGAQPYSAIKSIIELALKEK